MHMFYIKRIRWQNKRNKTNTCFDLGLIWLWIVVTKKLFYEKLEQWQIKWNNVLHKSFILFQKYLYNKNYMAKRDEEFQNWNHVVFVFDSMLHFFLFKAKQKARQYIERNVFLLERRLLRGCHWLNEVWSFKYIPKDFINGILYFFPRASSNLENLFRKWKRKKSSSLQPPSLTISSKTVSLLFINILCKVF